MLDHADLIPLPAQRPQALRSGSRAARPSPSRLAPSVTSSSATADNRPKRTRTRPAISQDDHATATQPLKIEQHTTSMARTTTHATIPGSIPRVPRLFRTKVSTDSDRSESMPRGPSTGSVRTLNG
jgi:hypothetical protein